MVLVTGRRQRCKELLADEAFAKAPRAARGAARSQASCLKQDPKCHRRRRLGFWAGGGVPTTREQRLAAQDHERVNGCQNPFSQGEGHLHDIWQADTKGRSQRVRLLRRATREMDKAVAKWSRTGSALTFYTPRGTLEAHRTPTHESTSHRETSNEAHQGLPHPRPASPWRSD